MLRVAVPLLGQAFCEHFGQCDGMFLCDVEETTSVIDRPRQVVRKERGCELMPQWLSDMAVQLVIAGGIGGAAVQRLAELNIRVAAGYHGDLPQQVVRQYLQQPGGTGRNPCADNQHQHRHCRER